MDDLNTLIDRVKTVSSLPDIFIKINDLADEPTTRANDLAKVMENDQGLNSKLLQLANSAFYGFPGKVATVSKAITIIGFRQLKELVLAASVRGMFNGLGKNSPVNMRSFWEHNIACGITARILAIYTGQNQPESYFTSGFLHDIGRLVLLEQYPVKYADVIDTAQQEQRLLFEIEKEVFGFNHADVSGALIKNWQLPSVLGETAAFHHNPELFEADSIHISLVHVANIITHACQIGFSGDVFVPPLSEKAWLDLKLTTGILEPVIEKLMQQYSDMVTFLMGEN